MLKLTKSEEKVINFLMREGDLPAAEVCERLSKELGWKQNSVYKLINKCAAKGYLKKEMPGNWCRVIIRINKIDGKTKYEYFASFIGNENGTVTNKEAVEIVKRIYGVIDDLQMQIMSLLWENDLSIRGLCKATGKSRKEMKESLKDLLSKECVKKKRFGLYYAIATEEDIKRRKEEFEAYLFNRK